MATVSTVRNGLNVDELLATINQIKKTPSLGKFRCHAKTRWISRAHSQSTFDSTYSLGKQIQRTTPLFMEGDEPTTMLGTDLAPTPTEAALHSLSACLSVSYAYHAALMGVEITSLNFELDTETDRRAFLDLDPSVRPGFSRINIKVNLACNGSPEQVHELHSKVERTSPMLDTFRNPVEIHLQNR